MRRRSLLALLAALPATACGRAAVGSKAPAATGAASPTPKAAATTPVPSPTAVAPTAAAAPSPTVAPTVVTTATATATATSAPAAEPTVADAVATPTAEPATEGTAPAAAQFALAPLAEADAWRLDPLAMPHPHGLTIVDGYAYTIDAGEVLAIPLAGGQADRLRPTDGLVEGYLVGELTALCAAPGGGALLLLDKRGDVYRLALGDRAWSMERAIDQRRVSPNPVYVAITEAAGRVYLLDSSFSQVWLHPAEGAADGYLPGGDAPWERAGTDLDLTRGTALAVDGDVYVLLRQGGGNAAGVARFRGNPPARDAAFAAGLDVADPVALALGPAGTLALVDGGGRRLRLLAAGDGAVTAELALPAEAPPLRAAWSDGEKLYLSAAGTIVALPGSGASIDVPGAQGPADRADDEQRLARLATLAPPIAGGPYLPLRDSLLPGATRIYRYGIHRGLDMYDGTMGVSIPFGAPVLAAGSGTVIRADVGYQEITMAEWEAIATECRRLHYTPDDLLDRLRGRQVWVDHGGGLVTRYVHLSAIAPGVQVGAQVQQGQAIAGVGNSGTSEGAVAGQSGAHLHFEVLVEGAYVGKWLSVPETRAVLARCIFPG